MALVLMVLLLVLMILAWVLMALKVLTALALILMIWHNPITFLDALASLRSILFTMHWVIISDYWCFTNMYISNVLQIFTNKYILWDICQNVFLCQMSTMSLSNVNNVIVKCQQCNCQMSTMSFSIVNNVIIKKFCTLSNRNFIDQYFCTKHHNKNISAREKNHESRDSG